MLYFISSHLKTKDQSYVFMFKWLIYLVNVSYNFLLTLYPCVRYHSQHLIEDARGEKAAVTCVSARGRSVFI